MSTYYHIPQRKPQPRTVGSWWLNKSRAELNAEAEYRKTTMSNSPEARHTSSLIVGHTGRTR